MDIYSFLFQEWLKYVPNQIHYLFRHCWRTLENHAEIENHKLSGILAKEVVICRRIVAKRKLFYGLLFSLPVIGFPISIVMLGVEFFFRKLFQPPIKK